MLAASTDGVVSAAAGVDSTASALELQTNVSVTGLDCGPLRMLVIWLALNAYYLVSLLNWLIAFMLIVALALSALNAIMGCARSLHQMSVDGQFPRWFQKINKHGVPDRAMFFNVLCSLLVVFAGGAVEIYSFSNVGYTFSFIPVLIGYYLLRKYKPDARRPVRLPEFFKYIALAMAAFYFVIWLYGGIYYSIIGHTLVYYLIGWGVLIAYLPLYWYRVKVEDKRDATTAPTVPAPSDP